MKRQEDYPLVLTVNEVMEILGIGRRVAYELMDEEGFPCIKIGTGRKKLKRVNRDSFLEWMEKQNQVS